MRLCHLCLALLLSACTQRAPDVLLSPATVPSDLLQPCAGYIGRQPSTEGDLAKAVIAEAQGRSCANAKLTTIAQILAQHDWEEEG